MKKLFLSFAILFVASTVLVSCGDDEKSSDGSSDASKDATEEAAEEKSICECMKMKKDNPELKEPPVNSGCEWITEMVKSKDREEMRKQEEILKRDCPELM